MTESTGEGNGLLTRYMPKHHTNPICADVDLSFCQVCDRVEDLARKDKVVVKLSVTGYSLGGLVARYMLG